jgi:putative tricarboxylic transport membrane protein
MARPYLGEIITCAAYLGLSIFLLFKVEKIPQFGVDASFGPRLWPLVILGLSALISASLFVSHLLTIFRGYARPSGGGMEAWWTLFLSMVTFLLYTAGMQYLGFLVATPLYMAGFMAVLGMRRWTYLVMSSIAVTLILNFLFIQFLFIPLPKGVGVFRDISLLFY